VDPHIYTEVEGDGVSLFAVRVHAVDLADEYDLLATEARLAADHSAGAALALQTMARLLVGLSPS
jgi:hypothetical protein